MPCECKVGGGTNALGLQQSSLSSNALSILLPREGSCFSFDTMGIEENIPGQSASGSLGSWGSGWGQPLLGSDDSAKMEPQAAKPRAAPPGAFTFTEPFRQLPAGVLLNTVSAEIPWVCNSGVNPTMFRVDHTGNVVSRYNMCTAAKIATIPVQELPLQVRVTPDGTQAIVTSFNNGITFIDTATNTVTKLLQGAPGTSPSGIAITPDGTYALVTNYDQNPNSYLTIVDIAGKKIDGKIQLDTDFPQSVFISPDGTLAWVTFPWNNVVEVIDILSGTLVQFYRNILQPESVAFNPTGTVAFVSAASSSSVAVIDTKTYSIIKTIPAGAGATDLQVSPDGNFVYVNNSAAKSITVINTQTLTGTTSSLDGIPQGSVLVPAQ